MTLLATFEVLHGISYRQLADTEKTINFCDALYSVASEMSEPTCVDTPSQWQLLQGDGQKERPPCKTVPQSVLLSAEHLTRW